MSEKKPSLALFDFDGTITTKDSLVEFIQFAVGKTNYYRGLLFLSPMLLQYKLKIIPNHLAKERLLSYFFKDWKIERFKKIANEYSCKHINSIIRPKALEEIQWHQEQGNEVVIVSASINTWLQPWCEQQKVKLISTELEVKNNLITGKFSTKNCYGVEKANRVHEKYDLKQYHSIYAYGDSSGDKDLLKLAKHSYYKPFRKN